VRERLHEAFGRIIWSDKRHEEIAAILLGLDQAEGPSALLSRLAARMPDASDVLSGARLTGFSGLTPNQVAGMLMFRVREGQLKRDIRNENARLRLLEGKDDTERDELFRHISELQQELTELRKRYRTE
jgi:hypothetical protein